MTFPPSRLGTICCDLLTRLDALHGGAPMFILETGTVRDMKHEGPTEERSTVRIGEWMQPRTTTDEDEDTYPLHTLASCDLNVSVCAKVLRGMGYEEWEEEGLFIKDGARIELWRGDAAKSIEYVFRHSGEEIAFLLLDSDSDPAVTLREYEAALPHLADDAIVVIDDCYGRSVYNGVDKGALVKKIHAGHSIANQCYAFGMSKQTDETVRKYAEELK